VTAPEPNYPPLSTREIQTLPEGARVIVTWSEGNDGPHEYRVHWRRGEPYAQTDEERHEGRVDLEKWLTYYVGPRPPFTRVWALAAPGAGGDFGARRLSVRDGVTAVTADDPFPYSELRNASHELFAKVWRAQKSGSVKVLSHEGQRLAQRMASHPEWQAWWERADDRGDAQAVTGAGVNPFAAVTMEAIAEGMIEENSVARRAYRRLQRDNYSHEQARTEIARAFTEVLWECETGHGVDFDSRLRQIFRRIMRGESAQEIFGE